MSFKCRAFTLVELLVVIGIIAVLVGILLPTINNARKQAAMAKCSSNQRQIVAACLMHATEHSGYFPLAGELRIQSANGWDGMAKSVLDTNRKRYTYAKWAEISTFAIAPFPAAVAPYMGYRNLDYSDAGRLDQALNDRETGVWKMFMCPATESFAFRKTGSGADTTPEKQGTMMTIFITSTSNSGSATAAWSTNTDFALNEGALGFHYDQKYASRRLAGNIARAKNSSQLMIVCDGLRGTTAVASWAPDPWVCFRPNFTSVGAISMADALAGNSKVIVGAQFDQKRHRGKMNVAFADGHIELVRIDSGDLARVFLVPK